MPNYPIYPQNYPQYPAYPQYQQPIMQPQMMQTTAAQQIPPGPSVTPAAQPQMQNGGFISVRSKDEARSWPIAPGNTVTFKDETAPYCYEKSMGFSQFEQPRFRTYELVLVEDSAQVMQSAPPSNGAQQAGQDNPYALKEDMSSLAGVVREINETVNAVQKDIDTLKGDMYGVVGKKAGSAKKEAQKKEVEADE